MQIKVQADYLNLIYPFAANQDVRYYLNGIAFDRSAEGGVIIVATDGHTLGLFHDKNGVFELGKGNQPPIIGRNDDLIRMCKTSAADRKNKLYREFRWDGLRAEIHLTNGDGFEGEMLHACDARAIDGEFPNYRKTISAEITATAPPCRVQPVLLRALREGVETGGCAARGKAIPVRPCNAMVSRGQRQQLCHRPLGA